MHISLHVCVCVHICISTNKQKNSQVLCFIKRTYICLSDVSVTRDKKKKKQNKINNKKKEKREKEKKNINMRVSVSSGKHLSTWVGQTKLVYSVSFIAIYLLCSSPLQKCVLTLDDVMLQVQRIYVNKGSRGKGQGSNVARHYKIYLLTQWKAIMQHLKDCTGKQADPMLDEWNLG